MPRGHYDRKKKETVKEPVESPKVETKPEEKPTFTEKLKEVLVPKEEPKKQVLEPLAAGQQYFESPEGEILIGDADKDRIWSRKTNSGRGGWVNPKR